MPGYSGIIISLVKGVVEGSIGNGVGFK